MGGMVNGCPLYTSHVMNKTNSRLPPIPPLWMILHDHECFLNTPTGQMEEEEDGGTHVM